MTLENYLKMRYNIKNEIDVKGGEIMGVSGRRRVILGLSGGVDSAVAAALLQEQGFEVIARYIKGYALPGIQCPEEQDIRDARTAALKLGIDFSVVSEGLELYRQRVYEPFLASYFSGKTPNPDIWCNQFVKFPLLGQLKEKYNADFVATGHYIRRVEERFFMARDAGKDQSYFLYAVPKDILRFCLFPIGEFEKKQVREIAKTLDLSVADKPGTQGVCMVGQLPIAEALEWAIEEQDEKLGPARAILIDKGREEELGLVPASVFFSATIGQRRGFGISHRFPIYVVAKDPRTMNLYFKILPEGERKFLVSEINWVTPETLNFPQRALVKLRTPGKMLPCKVTEADNQLLEVFLDDPDTGIAPGQSAVFYKKDGDLTELLGGGIIQ